MRRINTLGFAERPSNFTYQCSRRASEVLRGENCLHVRTAGLSGDSGVELAPRIVVLCAEVDRGVFYLRGHAL